MVDDDPFAPPVKKAVPLEQQLEVASIDELEFRIQKLKAEIDLGESLRDTPAYQSRARYSN